MSLFKKRPKKPTSAAPSAPAPAASPAPAPALAAAAAQSAALESPAPASDPSKDPNLIQCFDAFGRGVYLTRQQWRESVLPPHLQNVWDNPDQLYITIQEALNKGFAEDMIAPAEHLAEIDADSERGAVVLSIVYGQNARLDDSEQALRRYVESHGETGPVLAGLAKIHTSRGDHEQASTTLWRALELNPNMEGAFNWYLAINHEKGGDDAVKEALLRLAAVPVSWRARLWLARPALASKDLATAVTLYQEALEIAGQPVPADLLVQLSGELGQAGHLTELIQLTAAHFNAAVHGPLIGINLIRAHLGLGRIAAARAVLDQLEAQQRPDWQQPLAFWNAELTKAEFASTPPTQPLALAMVLGDGPTWLPAHSTANELFPAPIAAPIAFLGCTAAVPASDNNPVLQSSELPGRLSRAIPLFLAEQVRFSVRTPVHPITPWLQGGRPAWALGKSEWNANNAAAYVRGCAPQADYVVVTHLVATSDPWRLELRLIRTSDAECLTTKAVNLPSAQPEPALRRLATELLQSLVKHADRTIVRTPPHYTVPTGPAFGAYLLGLEQLLSIHFGSLDSARAHFLSNERQLLDGYLKFSLAQPENVVLRLALVQALLYLKDVRPQPVAEFRERVLLLQERYPLAAPAHEAVQRLLAAVYP